MSNVKRIALAIQYDGSGYHGWQTQQGDLLTIQTMVEKAASEVANHSVAIVCAGRTDAGVHATSQVVHFDTTVERSAFSWVFGINSNLPSSINVLWSKVVDSDFHARFSAISRRYRYIIYNHPIRPGLLRHQVTWHHRPLDINKMQLAADALLGKNNFNAYRSRSCQANSPVRTMHHLTIHQSGRLIVLDVAANAFLHHMVRNLAGVLMPIGAGLAEVGWAKQVLESQDRTQAGITARPNGLYLVNVGYPEACNLPKLPLGPFFLPESLL